MRPSQTELWLGLTLTLALLAVRWASAQAPIYVSSWAVRVTKGYQEAERLARKFGFVNLGQIFPDDQYFHLRHRGVAQQSLTPHWGHRLRLKKDPKVRWFEQQTLRRRVKRSLVVPTDPWFSKQWYMNKEIQQDLNILKAWNQGLTGRGVVISILDDGIEKDHPDLWANYDPLASYDFNDYDPDPQPRYTPNDENRHGTRCAGEVSATANNGFCGAGVAFNARIGGHHGPAPPVHRQAHGHLGICPAGCWHDRPGPGGQPAPDLEGPTAPGGPRVQAGAAAGGGLEDQRRGAPSPILPRMLVPKNVTACSDGSRRRLIRSLEHVQVQLSLSYSRRGDLEIFLTSPMGTRSTLVAIRPLDISGQGYNNWIFMSTHYWDEDPQGLWTLGLENKGYYFNTGTLYYYTLLLYGTAEDMTARPQAPQVTSRARACVQRDTEGLCQESHSPLSILAGLCLISSQQWWWLYSHPQQPVTEGQASCHPPVTPAAAA
ncbi:proprotein convertase subtilisin/kexin type 4 isoform X10 [Mus musculus]|uniref:proprotein convertase subtilisin/kexin type 4 isoform X10 n=1 Tax=Mus musculus TaxID=10090 RepID=UPI0003D73473|nr:proprotein convertase subtilisin/kexin type 4 isoform X10 [Mus musculus]|eukprot:XP_006513428.1 PREDICTED: proprotein convertase subtilisin/kexin type 4 isoform X8 [Mus musculus]